jgi:hypothetical protein
MIKLMDLLLEGNTSSTTFYHEVSTAIYCVKPNAKLTNGSDYKIYFDLGLVEAYGSDINKIPEKRFLLDSTANKKAIASNISDAKALAIKIRYQLGNPKRPMYWTGKAGDKGKYGAGDIGGVFRAPYGDVGISLKKGIGQLKNLTLGTFSYAMGIMDVNGQWFVNNYTTEFNGMTKDWVDLIEKEIINKLSRRKGKAKLKKVWASHKKSNWSAYQSEKIDTKDGQDILDGFGADLSSTTIERLTGEKNFKVWCRKIVSNTKGDQWASWKKARKTRFKNIFGDFFDKNEDNIRENLVGLFERQMSLGDKSIFYAADKGGIWWFLPSQKLFEKQKKKLKDSLYLDWQIDDNKQGYTMILQIGLDGGSKYIADIKINVRFASGQMNSVPDAKSSYKLGDKKAGWTAILGTF